MSIQLEIITNSDKQKTLIHVNPHECEISKFNARRTRDKEDVEMLAQRIERVGFEVTRSPWAYKEDGRYKIFAGGTRLEAVRLCSPERQKEFHIFLHEGYLPEDYVELAHLDNENDEYHIEVPFTDLWEYYHQLFLPEEEGGRGWTQKKIAQVCLSDMTLNNSKSLVSKRIKSFLEFSEQEKKLVQTNLDETHAFRLLELEIKPTFSDWLTTSQARHELLKKAVSDKKKNGKKTVEALRKDVEQYKKFIKEAENEYENFDELDVWYTIEEGDIKTVEYSPRTDFIEDLAQEKARTLTAVQACAREIRTKIRNNRKTYQEWLNSKNEQDRIQAEMDAKTEELQKLFLLGDAIEKITELEDGSVKLLLTDPPYGQDYQSNRRWVSPAPDKILNDTKEAAVALLGMLLEKVMPKLSEDAHVLVFCNWQNEPLFREILDLVGLNLKGSLIWVKEEHSAGDVEGAFGPSHERILHAVKGRPVVSPRIRDVLTFNRAKREDHAQEKPVDLLKALIISTTEKGDLVIDPLAGIASTLVAAYHLGRHFWGCEIDEKYWEIGWQRMIKEYVDAPE